MFPLYEEYTPPCVLGLSGGFHDAGATLISNQGDILFAGTPAGVSKINKGDFLEANIQEVGKLELNFN